jgi:hypothetical protein
MRVLPSFGIGIGFSEYDSVYSHGIIKFGLALLHRYGECIPYEYGESGLTTLWIFFISSMRFTLVCILPAVSIVPVLFSVPWHVPLHHSPQLQDLHLSGGG